MRRLQSKGRRGTARAGASQAPTDIHPHPRKLPYKPSLHLLLLVSSLLFQDAPAQLLPPPLRPGLRHRRWRGGPKADPTQPPAQARAEATTQIQNAHARFHLVRSTARPFSPARPRSSSPSERKPPQRLTNARRHLFKKTACAAFAVRKAWRSPRIRPAAAPQFPTGPRHPRRPLVRHGPT